MNPVQEQLAAHLLRGVRLVHQNLGMTPSESERPDTQFGDLLDSMGMVEFLALVADDLGIAPETIERCVDGKFTTVAELAVSLGAAGFVPPQMVGARPDGHNLPDTLQTAVTPRINSRQDRMIQGWLAAPAVHLPDTVQSAAQINALLQRPAGWLENHAGIEQRHTWAGQDPLAAAAATGRNCLEQVGLTPTEIGALLVTSEAPPLLAGLAAALHYRLGLHPCTTALEVGGACTGFLAALWTAQALLPRLGAVLLIAVEAPTQHLAVGPGPAGEAAALFGDGAAACLFCNQPPCPTALPVTEIRLGCDGSQAHLIRVERSVGGSINLLLEGGPLATRAIKAMALAVRELTEDHGCAMENLRGVIVHGGNGRMPGLLARQLLLPADKVWSNSLRTGNLGSMSFTIS
jgi:3-oxoacyl-[acyl-carrier-protein] synthase-3